MLSEEEKKAIKYFKNRLKDVQTNYTSMYYKVDNLEILLNLIGKQQAEIEKQDKMINRMAGSLLVRQVIFEEPASREDIINYFSKLVEEE